MNNEVLTETPEEREAFESFTATIEGMVRLSESASKNYKLYHCANAAAIPDFVTAVKVSGPGKGASQSESAIYTKAMFDAGQKVKVGMVFATECGKYKAEMVNLKSICFADENNFLCVIPIGLAKPIVPERDKIIDAAALALEMKHGSAGYAYKKYCATLYDAKLLVGGEL